VQQLKSTFSLLKKITTSVSASYNAGGGGASGSVDTSHQMQVNSDDQNFLFTFESISGSTFAVPPGTKQFEVSDSAFKLLETVKSDRAQDNLVTAI
jgi:hypothetical protein